MMQVEGKWCIFLPLNHALYCFTLCRFITQDTIKHTHVCGVNWTKCVEVQQVYLHFQGTASYMQYYLQIHMFIQENNKLGIELCSVNVQWERVYKQGHVCTGGWYVGGHTMGGSAHYVELLIFFIVASFTLRLVFLIIHWVVQNYNIDSVE